MATREERLLKMLKNEVYNEELYNGALSDHNKITSKEYNEKLYICECERGYKLTVELTENTWSIGGNANIEYLRIGNDVSESIGERHDGWIKFIKNYKCKFERELKICKELDNYLGIEYLSELVTSYMDSRLTRGMYYMDYDNTVCYKKDCDARIERNKRTLINELVFRLGIEY